jgi:translocation and assembly module TamA
MSHLTIAYFSLLLVVLVAFQSAAAVPTYKVNGVDDPDVLGNILLLLSDLDVETSQVPERLWKLPIKQSIESAIQPFGYYNSKMTIIDDGEFISVNVFLGSPLIIANITLEVVGAGREDEWFSTRFKQFPLLEGQRLIQRPYDKFKANMLATAVSRGYFDFQWQVARLDLVRKDSVANILLIAQSGPRYKFGGLRIKGNKLAADVINKINPLNQGDFYQADKLNQLNSNLNQTGYFSRAIARPIVKDAVNNEVPIEITIAHKPQDIFDLGVGGNTDTKAQFSAKWRRPWVNSDGHSLSSELFLSDPRQSVDATYKIPMADVNDNYASIKLGFERIDNNDTFSEQFNLAAYRFWRPKGSDWQQGIFISYQTETFRQGLDTTQTTELVMPGYSISGWRSEGGLDINWGNRNIFTLEGGSNALASDIDIIRLSGATKWIRTYGQHRFTARAEVGAILTDDFERVPSSLRFFAGGDQSIRGFNYNTISPVDSNNDLTGGRYLVTASVEYAYPIFEQWRVATFFDAGTSTNDFEEDIKWGAGLGVHYLSVVGPIRLYLARPSDDKSAFQVHFSLGPEL